MSAGGGRSDRPERPARRASGTSAGSVLRGRDEFAGAVAAFSSQPRTAARRRPELARRLAAIVLALAVAALAGAAPAAAAPRPGLTLTGLEPDFMCVLCHEGLNVSQSAQADQERSLISALIAEGKTKAQIEAAMVAQYTTAVLAVPRVQGFNVVLYVLPPVLVVAGLAALAVLLPRWRRRARAVAAEANAAAPPPLDAADAKRLDEELARYDG